MHDLAGLTNLKSVCGLGISGYSAIRKTRKKGRVGGKDTKGERKCGSERAKERGGERRETDLGVLCLLLCN